jgi:hypothetical protein
LRGRLTLLAGGQLELIAAETENARGYSMLLDEALELAGVPALHRLEPLFQHSSVSPIFGTADLCNQVLYKQTASKPCRPRNSLASNLRL